MTSSPSITGSVSRRAICRGALVPVRQAVVTMSTPLETYSTENRPAVIICRIQYRSAAPHGGMLARIERHSSRAVLASTISGFTPAGLNLFGPLTAARRFFCALLKSPQKPRSRISKCFEALSSVTAFHALSKAWRLSHDVHENSAFGAESYE